MAEGPRRINWSPQETETFIKIFKEKNLKTRLDSRQYRKDDIYQDLAIEMEARGYKRSLQQVKTKWRELKRARRIASAQTKTNGANCRTMPFFEDLDELLGSRPSSVLINVKLDPNQDFGESSSDEGGICAVVPVHSVDEALKQSNQAVQAMCAKNSPLYDICGESATGEQPSAEDLLAHLPDPQQTTNPQTPTSGQQLAQEESPNEQTRAPTPKQTSPKPTTPPACNPHLPSSRPQPHCPGRPALEQPAAQLPRGTAGFDKSKGKGSYAKALAGFHEKWAESQQRLMRDMLRRHQDFCREQWRVQREWEKEILATERAQAEQIAREHNATLVSVVDRLIDSLQSTTSPHFVPCEPVYPVESSTPTSPRSPKPSMSAD